MATVNVADITVANSFSANCEKFNHTYSYKYGFSIVERCSNLPAANIDSATSLWRVGLTQAPLKTKRISPKCAGSEA